MLLRDTILAYLHFISIIAVVSTVAIEAALVRSGLNQRWVAILGRVDLFYLVTAMLALASGFSRAIWGIKGWDYYQNNTIFWIKISLFVAVGLISIIPTLRFIRWGKELSGDPSAVVADAEIQSMSRIIYLELGLLVLIPLMATLVSRGYGY